VRSKEPENLTKEIMCCRCIELTPGPSSDLLERERSALDELQRRGRIDRARSLAGVPARHRTPIEKATGPWKEKRDAIKRRLGTGMVAGLLGPRGTGKTQMACDLIWFVCDLGGMGGRYATAMDIFLDVRSTYHGSGRRTEQTVLSDFWLPDLLVIDEVHERGETAWEDRLLTHLVDARYRDKRDTILVGNQTVHEFKAAMGSSIISRMVETGGLWVCDWDSFRKPRSEATDGDEPN